MDEPAGGRASGATEWWRALDRATRWWVRGTGRPVDLRQEHWLQGPVGDRATVGDRWPAREAARRGGVVGRPDPGSGLVPDLTALDGPGFAAGDLATAVRDFYERTASWRLDVWAAWSPAAWPGGWLVSTLFARRLEQLALPLRPLDVAHGMTSTVTPLLVSGDQVAALWLRRLRSTGEVTYSGCYDLVSLPGERRPCVRVCFPLPDGRLVVLLRARATAGGALELSSPRGEWGAAGAYLVVERPPRCWARRIPLVERFRVFVDDEGVLRTDHALDLGRVTILRLHYRMTRQRPDS